MSRTLGRTVIGIRAAEVRRAPKKALDQLVALRAAEVPNTLMSGRVMPFGDQDDYVISNLKSSPAKYSHHRGGEYLHVSDLIKKCIRKVALAERHNLTLAPEILSDSQEITFGQGSMIGDYVVNKVISGHPGKVFGRWSCQCGNLVTQPMTLARIPDRTCENCHTETTKYTEINIQDDDLKISGSIDLLFLLPEQALYITELKSMAADAWKELIRPLPEHTLQATSYWYLMNKAGYSLADRASILYICKGWLFGKHPYKEFVIKPQEHLHRLSDHFADAAARKVALAGGPLPPRVTCATREVPEARKCELAGLCFNGE